MTTLPGHPDRGTPLRLARLLLLLAVVDESPPRSVDIDRLAAYDFLAAHPLVLVAADDDPDRAALRLTGFDDRAVAYASAPQRYLRTRLGLRDDLALLVAYDLVSAAARGRVLYGITDRGRSVAAGLNAAYARSYTMAARIVVGRLRRLSDRRLHDGVRDWTVAAAARHHGTFHRTSLDLGPTVPLAGLSAERDSATSPADSEDRT